MQTPRQQLRPRPAGPVRVGFVPLIDAAPAIVALENGYFADAGVDVVLSRELGWANLRDKLAFRRLDAAQALIGLPIHSAISDQTTGDPMRTVMALGSGGDAITLSTRLATAGVTSAVTLGQYVNQSNSHARGGRPLVFAHVFDASIHHYLLRDWLVSGEVQPDRDVRLCVLPPQQMPAHLAAGHIDGFCVGEPWNSIAHEAGHGCITALTSDLLPAHPDKVLAVNERWADGNASLVEALVRALLRACQFCQNSANADAVAELLSRPNYLGVPAATLAGSLRLDRRTGPNKISPHLRPTEWRMRSFDATFPSQTHAAWFVTQMQRWGHADGTLDPWAVAVRATDATAYRAAAEALDLLTPVTDTPPMPLRGGRTFERSPRLEGMLV